VTLFVLKRRRKGEGEKRRRGEEEKRRFSLLIILKAVLQFQV
jgi:hypothetical protein